MSETCATCRFWDDSRPVDGVGECRRYPPTTHFDADAVGVVTRTFALTAPDEWCGEHQPREVAPAIVRSPDTIDNAWRIDGTRIPVKAIKNFHKAGYDIAEIIKGYPTLSPQQVRAALNFVEPEEPEAREPGWYWVKRNGTDHWQVAEWQAEWWLAGTDGPLDDEELIVIGRRLEPPA